MDVDTAPPVEVQVVFRGKKRKAYRQRTETRGDNNNNNNDNDNNDNNDAPRAPSVDPASNMSAPLNPPSAFPDAPGAAATSQRGREEDGAEEESGLSVAEVLRLRNLRKSRLGGVKFSVADSAPPMTAAGGEEDGNNYDDELSLMIREEESRVLERSSSAAAGVTKRFAPQTGLSGELINKHM